MKLFHLAVFPLIIDTTRHLVGMFMLGNTLLAFIAAAFFILVHYLSIDAVEYYRLKLKKPYEVPPCKPIGFILYLLAQLIFLAIDLNSYSIYLLVVIYLAYGDVFDFGELMTIYIAILALFCMPRWYLFITRLVEKRKATR